VTAPAIPEVDYEGVLRALLEVQTGITTCTETPASLTPPLFHVVVVGGVDDGVVLAEPTVSVHAFGADRPSARALALRARTALYASRGLMFEGAVITGVVTRSSLAWTPYDDTSLRRVTGTYSVRMKRA
jgi:hypothetical protein